MTAEGWVLIIGAAGAQVGMILQNWKMGRAVGTPNGLGSIHDALKTMDGRLSTLCERLKAVEDKVGP